MATTASLPDSETIPEKPAKAGGGLLPRLAIGLVLLLAVAGGAWFYLTHIRHAAGVSAAAATGTVHPETLHSLALEPFVVNLADPSGSAGGSYLRVVMVLRIADSPEEGEAAKKDKQSKAGTPKEGNAGEDPILAGQTAELRDTALGVLTSQRPDALLTSQGKEDLKRQLLSAFATRNPDMKVKEILFTEFLVQS